VGAGSARERALTDTPHTKKATLGSPFCIKPEVSNLGKGERVEEVARMLGGIDLTKESLAHAKKMVVTAKG